MAWAVRPEEATGPNGDRNSVSAGASLHARSPVNGQSVTPTQARGQWSQEYTATQSIPWTATSWVLARIVLGGPCSRSNGFVRYASISQARHIMVAGNDGGADLPQHRASGSRWPHEYVRQSLRFLIGRDRRPRGAALPRPELSPGRTAAHFRRYAAQLDYNDD